MSSGDKINVNFECLECGGTVLTLPDDHTDDSIATCKQCGVELARWGDIKEKARNLAADTLRKKIQSAFKGGKGWKMK